MAPIACKAIRFIAATLPCPAALTPRQVLRGRPRPKGRDDPARPPRRSGGETWRYSWRSMLPMADISCAQEGCMGCRYHFQSGQVQSPAGLRYASQSDPALNNSIAASAVLLRSTSRVRGTRRDSRASMHRNGASDRHICQVRGRTEEAGIRTRARRIASMLGAENLMDAVARHDISRERQEPARRDSCTSHQVEEPEFAFLVIEEQIHVRRVVGASPRAVEPNRYSRCTPSCLNSAS